MNPDFEGLLRALVSAKVEFVLVGGYSAMLHGSSMMTRDIDIVCPMDPPSLGKIYLALETFHPVHRTAASGEPFTAEQATRGDWKNLYLKTDLGVLDCLGEVTGIGDFKSCLERSISLDLGDYAIKTLSLEALIAAKRAMGRPRDLHTAKELELI